MHQIKLVGQVISSTNYATSRLFNFNPPMVKAAAEQFLACGVTDIEVPVGVLDPENRCKAQGIDVEKMKETVAGLPAPTRVLGSYFGAINADQDIPAMVAANQRRLDHMLEYFPHFTYTMVHPSKVGTPPEAVEKIMGAWAEVAEYAQKRKPGFQVCLHNHYDSACETAEQVRSHLRAIEKINNPGLRWAPDTGHCHGMGDAYMEVFGEFAHLIGNHFHIKSRVPAFDKLHDTGQYAADRDIWGNKAEFGRGLYGGFVNPADPEIVTPFKQIFKIIREKARPTAGVVWGAVEIDVPRQHPTLEIMCAVLYLKLVHGIEPGQPKSVEEIARAVFADRMR